MPNIFVFGIGGTGSRVIRALTMLLASGARLPNTDRIIPIIIDVDAQNADTSRTLNALEAYRAIRRSGYNDTEQIRDGFFNTNLDTLSSLANGDDYVQDSFQLQFENLNQTFLRYLDPNEELAGTINMDLLEALYDNTPHRHAKDAHTELHLSLDLGFKGNPNIGSVVFNNLADSAGFRFILRSINENDRIFIVSSIFGGTGSSGFPQLVRLLRQQDNLRRNRCGALTVMPYFNVTDDPASAINSEYFNSKTEAALTYYNRYLRGQVNAFYQLWDEPLQQYDNRQGGPEQRNNAHLIELIGATSIIDFANKADDAIPRNDTHYFDFGIRQGDRVVDTRHFFERTANDIMLPLTLFTYAMKLYLDIIPSLGGEAFYKELDLEKKYRESPLFQSMSSFFDRHYKSWLTEMGENERSFLPFNLHTDLNGMIREKPLIIKKVMGIITDAGLNDRFLKTELGKLENELAKSMPNQEHRFFKLLNLMAKVCFAKLGSSLPTMQ